MQALSRLLVRQSLEAPVAPAAIRLYGSVVPAGDSNPFLRFASPVPASIDHAPLLSSLPETQVTTLPNGLRVATESVPFAEAASVGLYIAGGSRYETDASNGSANFLERVLFKGTKKRSGAELEAELSSMGACLSASTGREQIRYSADVLGKDTAKAVSILGDLVQNAALAEKDVAAVRESLMAEMKKMPSNHPQLLCDHLHATAFQYSPLGRTVAGSAANVAGMTKESLTKYMKGAFRGPRMVLAASGAVNHEELVKAATEALGGIPDDEPSATLASMVAKDPSRFTGSYVHDRFPDATLCHMAVAYKGAAATDADAVPLMVMKYMLGCLKKGETGVHNASQLTQTVALEHLAHSFTGFSLNYADTGLFGFRGITTKEHCEDFAYYAMGAMTGMCYDVNEGEIALAKNQLKASIMLAQASPSGAAASIGSEMLAYGRRLPVAELIARIDAVDSAAIRGVADRFIYDQDMVVASVGDVQFMPDMSWFRRRSYWNRY